MKHKNLLLGLSVLFPLSSFANTDSNKISFSNVEIFPISKEDIAKYQYDPNNYLFKSDKSTENFSIEDAQSFYKNLYNTIIDNYVKPITQQQITNIILESLSGFADKINIEATDKRILIYDKNLKLIGNFAKISNNDTEEWVNILVKTLLTLRKNSKRIADAHQEQIYYITTLYLLKSLDENGDYTNPVAKENNLYDYSTNLGFTYRRTTFGIQVLSIFKDSPTYFSDIKTGDIITAINKIPTRSLTDEQLEYILTNNETDILDIDYVSYIFNHPANVFIRKNRIIQPSITQKTFDKTPIIEIQNFKYDSAKELKSTLDNNKDIDGLIIDLRGNINGIPLEAIETANLFISNGDILKTTGNNDEYNQTYTAKQGDILNGKPIVIIADNTTKGPAEIFASIMDGSKRAIVIGSPTFGNGNLQETFALKNNSSIRISTSTATNAKNISVDKIGVVPVICTSTIADEKDIQTLLDNVNKDTFKDNRPTTNNKTAEIIKNIRNSCPALYPTKETNDLMLKTATAILLNQPAYNKLLEK